MQSSEDTHSLAPSGILPSRFQPGKSPRTQTILRRQPQTHSEIEETVTEANRDAATGVWEGTMRREEFVPAQAGQPRRNLGAFSGVRVRFDPTRCEVVLPTKVRFEHPSASNWPDCSEDTNRPIPDPPLSDSAFRSLANRVLAAFNTGLNGWYSVRLSGCERPCAGRDIPIRVEAQETSSNPDTVIVLANIGGRSCASPERMTIHAGRATQTRLIHEGMHAALGAPDEYPPEPSDIGRDPASVRTDDLSRASQHEDYSDWGLLHPRHFAFVPAFLKHIYPQCQADLHELGRPRGVDWHFSGALSYANIAGGSGYSLRLGIDLGIPLDRQREWQILVGAHIQGLLRIEEPLRYAFLGGLRAGFLGQPHFSEGGPRISAFLGTGVGSFQPLQGPTGPAFSAPRVTAPYAELGGAVGYGWAPSHGSAFSLSAEFSAGTSLGIPPTLRGDSREVRFFQAGIQAALLW